MADIKFFKNLDLKRGFEFFKKPRENILGIDIGSASVKVVQLRKEKETAVLETYGEIAAGPYDAKAAGQAATLNLDKTAEALFDLLKEAETKSKEALISIPLRSGFLTIITLPLVSERELKEAMALEARRYIPIPLTDVEIDWWEIPETLVLKKEEGKEEIFSKRKTTEVLLAAIHKETIEKYRNVGTKLGLEIRGFEIEAFGAARSSLRHELSPVLLMDLGASSIKFVIMDYGIIRLAHQLPQGSQNLTLALQNSLGGDFTLAEEIKRKIGLSEKPEDQETVKAIKPQLEYVFAEAKKVIAEYRRHSKRSVSHAILAGGGAALKGINDFAANSLGIETDLANPFASVAHPVFLEPVLKEIGPSFATAVGLALRGLKEEE